MSLSKYFRRFQTPSERSYSELYLYLYSEQGDFISNKVAYSNNIRWINILHLSWLQRTRM
jgi:hypothetical protein